MIFSPAEGRKCYVECHKESLEDFFRTHKKEIVEMGIYEFDQEVYERVLREDSEAIGIKKGIKIGHNQGIEIGKERIFRIYKEIRKGETDNKKIAESCSCTVEEVKTAREQFGV